MTGGKNCVVKWRLPFLTGTWDSTSQGPANLWNQAATPRMGLFQHEQDNRGWANEVPSCTGSPYDRLSWELLVTSCLQISVYLAGRQMPSAICTFQTVEATETILNWKPSSQNSEQDARKTSGFSFLGQTQKTDPKQKQKQMPICASKSIHRKQQCSVRNVSPSCHTQRTNSTNTCSC